MDIVELAVTMQTGVCPFIVGFYGCLIRDVSQGSLASVVLVCVYMCVRVHVCYVCGFFLGEKLSGGGGGTACLYNVENS